MQNRERQAPDGICLVICKILDDDGKRTYSDLVEAKTPSGERMNRQTRTNPQRSRPVAKAVRTDAAALAAASSLFIAIISLILRALS